MVARFFSGSILILSIARCAAPTSDDAVKPMTGYATPESFCAARAEAECQKEVVQRCGGKDAMTCAAKGKAECVARIPQGTRFMPERAAACIEQTRGAYADGQLTAGELDAMKATCARVFSGPGGARAPCTVAADCSSADGLECVIPLGEKAGKCLAPRVVEQGGACFGEADVCSAGFFCDPMKKQCVPRGGEGESCWEMRPCAARLKCNNVVFSSACVPLGPAGTPCAEDAQCASGLCNKAKSSADGTCADVIVLSPLAAACAPFQ